MKKSLLLLGAALLMTASAMAQTYTNPRTKAAAPATEPASTYNYAAEDGGDPLYLWNVKYGGFYSHIHKGGSGFWETRAAAVDTIGAQIVFTRQNPQSAEAEQGAEWIDAQGNTDIYLLTSIVSSKSDQQMCSFADAWDAIYTDWNVNTQQPNRYWHVKVNGDYLNLSIAKVNETVVDWDMYDLCVRAPEIDSDKRVYLNMPSEEVYNEETGEYDLVERILLGEEVGTDWAIVTPETYEAYIDVAKAQNSLYALGNQLAAALNSAVADTDDGIRPLLDTQIQILGDVSATAEMLQAAIDQVPDIVVEYKANTVTPENPANFTTKITNPDFAGGYRGGWQGGEWGHGGREADCAEHWHATFDHYQDLSGLPEGVYKVVVDGFNRIQDNHEADYVGWKKGETGHARLYVGCESYGMFDSPMKPASAGGDSESHLSGDGGDTDYSIIEGGEVVGHWYAPNSMYGFVTWVEYWNSQNKRPYGTEAFGALVDGEALRIGARNTVNNEWVIVDNFELWYLGSTDGAYRVWAKSLLASFPTYDWTGENVYYGKPEKDYYENYRTILGSTTATAEQITEAAKNLSVVMDTVQASFDIYAEYVKEIDWENWLADNKLDITTPEFVLLEEYMDGYAEGPSDTYPNGNAKYILDVAAGVHEGPLSVEQMTAEIQFIKDMKAAALDAGLVKGANFTSYIVNPDFNYSDGRGWTLAPNSKGPNWSGGLSSNPCAEVWNGTFDIYQDIENAALREGLYKVTVRAFQRTGNNASAWSDWVGGTATVTTEVYLNEYATPVQNLQAVQYKQKMGNHRDAATHEVEGMTVYTLDDMNGASAAFSLPDNYSTDGYMNWDPANNLQGKAVQANFKQTVYGLLTEPGKVRLGIRCQTPGKDNDYWSLWDKFELYYMGYDVEGVQFVMNDYYNRADDINASQVGSSDWDAYDEKRSDVEGMMAAAIDKLADYGIDDVVAVTDPTTQEVTYDSEKLYQELIDFIASYQRVLDSKAKLAELNDKISEVNSVYDDLYDDLPVDLLEEVDGWIADHFQNNEGSLEDFERYIEEGNDYITQMYDNVIDWTDLPVNLTDFITNPRYDDGTNGWTGGGAVSYNACEGYMNTFDHYQTINVTRPGYYLLTVRAFERIGQAAADYEVFTNGTYAEMSNMTMYVTMGQQTVEHHICQLAKHAVTDAEQANFEGTWASVGDGLHVTNNMQGAASFFYYYENNPADWDNIDETAGYYRNPLTFYADAAGPVTIGIKKPTRSDNNGDWAIWGDWKLWYLGDGSSVLVGIDDITNSNTFAAPVQRSIYNVNGARVQSLQRGINIVKTIEADGTVRVKKVLVK